MRTGHRVRHFGAANVLTFVDKSSISFESQFIMSHPLTLQAFAKSQIIRNRA